MNLNSMFEPESVAVIGASNEGGKVGNAIMKSMKRKYKGDVYPINLNESKVLGLEAYESVMKVEGNIDLAMIAIPAEFVPQAVRECGEKGIENVIIVTAGFREAGQVELEEEVVEIAKEHGVRFIGPNCLGIYNSKNDLDTIFNPPERQARPKKGSVAFLSQSGAFGAAMLDWFSESDIGISKFVSYGNRAGLDEADFIEYLNEDEETDVITYYIEGLKDGRKFMKAAEKCSKPIVALKSGRTSAGSNAAASHTASLAGNDEVYDAAFDQSGILRVKTVREMVVVLRTLTTQPPAKGNKIAIVTNGGGVGVMCADSLAWNDLELTDFTKKTCDRFKKAVEEGIIPDHSSLNNPIDIVGDAPSERYEAAMEIVLEDENVDALIVAFLFQSPAIEEDIVSKTAGMKKYGKPIVAIAPGGEYTHKMGKKIEDQGIPVYETPEEGVEAIRGVVEFGDISISKNGTCE
ncbi:MAG: acetate--CoA ligase family protein [Candidatus Saliniplasma sp.]